MHERSNNPVFLGVWYIRIVGFMPLQHRNRCLLAFCAQNIYLAGWLATPQQGMLLPTPDFDIHRAKVTLAVRRLLVPPTTVQVITGCPTPCHTLDLWGNSAKVRSRSGSFSNTSGPSCWLARPEAKWAVITKSVCNASGVVHGCHSIQWLSMSPCLLAYCIYDGLCPVPV
jgi:hypothetical protein